MPNRARMLLNPQTNKRVGSRRSCRIGRQRSNRRRRRALKKTRRDKTRPWEVVKGRRICAADQLNHDLTICCKGERFFEATENRRISRLVRLPANYKGFQKIGIYSSNMLCAVRTRFIGRAINKASRFFGIDPKEDSSWAALLRCIVCCGMNPADFRSVMRIRDLKIRRRFSAYRKAVTGFIAHLPGVHVARALDRSF